MSGYGQKSIALVLVMVAFVSPGLAFGACMPAGSDSAAMTECTPMPAPVPHHARAHNQGKVVATATEPCCSMSAPRNTGSTNEAITSKATSEADSAVVYEPLIEEASRSHSAVPLLFSPPPAAVSQARLCTFLI